MKKITKKNRKASRKKAVKDLDVKPAKGRTVRGGHIDASPPKIYESLAKGTHIPTIVIE